MDICSLECHFRKYLSDPTEDVRVATENILADFLREIRDVTIVQRRNEEQLKLKREAAVEQNRHAETEKERLPDITMANSERGTFIPEDDNGAFDDSSLASPDEKQSEHDGRDAGRK